MPSSSPSLPVFVLVGHCSPDASMLRSAITHVLPDATFIGINSHADLAKHRHRGTVWLVNRVLDGDFGQEEGMTVLAKAAAGDDAPTVMLISNYEDTQVAAMALGAVRGFGKLSLYTESTVEAIRNAVARALSAKG